MLSQEQSRSIVNAAGGSGSKEGRDSWCTPKWLAEVIGRVDLDPCSNPRSRIDAATTLMLEYGDDGLASEPGNYYIGGRRALSRAKPYVRTFINPPYARGEVIKWIRHYRHTRFIFLLRFDPSTDWFAELAPHCTHIWVPSRRINFEPPPGVKSSSNPFPHALYLRDPDPTLLERLAPHGYLLDTRLIQAQHATDAKIGGLDAADAGSGRKGSSRKGKAGGSRGGVPQATSGRFSAIDGLFGRGSGAPF